MSVTIPSLDPVTDILDTDKIMVTQSSGQTYTIDGASFNKRNQAVIASSTTLTGAPLKTGNIVRVYFTADITGVNTTTVLSLSYNGSSKNVKVPKNGALVNFTAQNLGGTPTVYKYLQAYTTLELLYDGTQFVIIGNPVVLSGSNYTIYADGLKRVDAVTSGDKNMVTSDAVYNETQKYDYTHYVSGFTGIYKISVPYVNNSNSTLIGSIEINGRGANGYILNFYTFVNESDLTDATDVGNIIQFRGGRYSDKVLEQTLKWTIDTTNKRINFLLKKGAGANSRIAMKILHLYTPSNIARDSITFTQTAETTEWDNTTFSRSFVLV